MLNQTIIDKIISMVTIVLDDFLKALKGLNVYDDSNPAKTILYRFNIHTGKITAQNAYLAFNHTNAVRYCEWYQSVWYMLELIHAQTMLNTVYSLCDKLDESELPIVSERVKALESAYKALKTLLDVDTIDYLNAPITVRLHVCADRGIVLPEYKSLFIPVEKALSNGARQDVEKALNEFCPLIWRADERAGIEKYHFNANSRLSESVWRVYYTGIKRTKQGDYNITTSKSLAFTEVIKACFYELQIKSQKSAEKIACDKASAQPADKASAQPADKASAQPADKASAQPADKASAQPADKASAQPADKASAQPADKASKARAKK